MKRPDAPVLACLALLLAALTGCGGFSSGNSPDFGPPPPPDFSKPEVQGRVTGTLVVEGGFLGELASKVTILSRLADEQAAEERARQDGREEEEEDRETPEEDPPEGLDTENTESGPAGAADVYRAMRVRVEGVRRDREADVEGDGSFEVEKLPDGDYTIKVFLEENLLASFPVRVVRQETTRVSLTLLGYDLADLDGDESREDLAVRLEVRSGKKGGGFVRVVLPDGSVRVHLANGGREYLLPGGIVRREAPGQGATFRYDHDLDGLPDPDDPDYRRLRKKPVGATLEGFLGGTAFPPLVRWAGAGGPFGSGQPGDLVLFQAEVARSFAAPAAEVGASLHGPGGEVFEFPLRDDGGEVDLNPDWPGHQPSGDLVEGDGVFSHLLPVDATTAPFLFGREVVVVAKDAEGRPSNRFAFFLYEQGVREEAPEPGRRAAARPWDHVRGLEFLGRAGPRGPEVQARFEASDRLSGIVATLIGPGDFRKVFGPGDFSGAGWSSYETRPSPIPRDGIYYVVIGVPEGPVYYAGRRLDTAVFRRSRTGG